jgi:perosamine synthetase
MKLAINGGPKVRTKLFPSQDTFDKDEYIAVMKTMFNGRLSNYRANWTEDFYGGPNVRRLERDWSDKFGSRYSIAVNSATSGLIAACGAIGLKPGDEIIVTPYSMTCSGTVPLMFGAIPIFADVEPEHFCLDPVSVEQRITPRTKAIIAVSLFGQPYDPRINKIAKDHKLYVIEDAAQAPGAKYKDNFTGTLADIGIFSFNYGKHMNAGEGGIITTSNPELDLRCRLFMNNGDAVTNDIEKGNTFALNTDIVGYNFRMTELTAAVAVEQLKKFYDLLEKRMANVLKLDEMLGNIQGIHEPEPRPFCTHTYYVLPYLWTNKELHRDKYIEAVKAELMPRKDRDTEGVPIGCGYIKPIYLMPLFQSQAHWAFKQSSYRQVYKEGLCPVVERLWKDELFLTLLHAPNSKPIDMQDVGDAFAKVWENKDELF